jgi:fused signal recognition particle receptor
LNSKEKHMLGFLKRKPKLEENTTLPTTEDNQTSPAGFFTRLKSSLSKTRKSFAQGMASIFLGKKSIDAALIDGIETQLLLADIGVDATQSIIQDLTQRLSRQELKDGEAVLLALKDEMTVLLKPSEQALIIDGTKKPFVILMIGVNGAGKTTTIGKLAKRFQQEGKKVMLAAGDTFRAAAVEQLEIWGERNNIPVITQHAGADSAAVIFDAIASAKARDIDVLIADTAGRLHTQNNLMEELKKIKRVIKKQDETAPHETLLILDAGNGQNALSQAKQFHEAVQISGICLTKLDGTAKGGIIFAIAKQLKLPIRFIGIGESIEDLRSFEAENFVDALFED